MKCTQLNKLHAEISISDSDYTQDRITHTALFEAAPGCFVHLALGSAGLAIYHGASIVCIPVDALVELAQRHDPSLKPEAIAAADVTTRSEREKAALEFRARLEAKAAAKRPVERRDELRAEQASSQLSTETPLNSPKGERAG